MFVIIFNLVYLACYGKSFRVRPQKRKTGSPTPAEKIVESLRVELGPLKKEEHDMEWVSSATLYENWYEAWSRNPGKTAPLGLFPGDIIIGEEYACRWSPALHKAVKKCTSPQGLFGGHVMIAVSQLEPVPPAYADALDGRIAELNPTKSFPHIGKFGFVDGYYFLIVMNSASSEYMNQGITFRVLVLREATPKNASHGRRLVLIDVEPHWLVATVEDGERWRYHGAYGHLSVFGPPSDLARMASVHFQELHEIIVDMHGQIDPYEWNPTAAVKSTAKGLFPATLREGLRSHKREGLAIKAISQEDQVESARHKGVICSSIPLMMWSLFLKAVIPSQEEAYRKLGSVLPLTGHILPKHLVKYLRGEHRSCVAWNEKY